jgi:8-oxo-dGTP pyrophosphatase MutT (NUDIX family)
MDLIRAAGEIDQVAALCWRLKSSQLQILLVTSRETKRWVTPKGWPMKGLTDWNTAKREAFEEAGVEGRVRKQPVGAFSYGKRKKSGLVKQTQVSVFPLEVIKLTSSWPEKTERERCWFSLEEAATKVQEPELQNIIRTFAP